MNPSEFDLTEASHIYAIANTPLFLVRKLKEDPIPRKISEQCSAEQILGVLRTAAGVLPATIIDAVRPYAFLVALWLMPEPDGLERAAEFDAPNFNWYGYILAELLRTFSPVQMQDVQALNLQSPLIVARSDNPITSVIVP
jgi:hypothetical protein